MKEAFADTGYWIALINPKDNLHTKVKSVSKELGQVIIVTSEMVLTEFANYFSSHGTKFRETVAKTIDGIRSNPNVRLIPQTSIQFQSALSMYRSHLDKQWSLTDCASIQIMRECKIEEALAYDAHFVQASFKALLRE
jgi:predicted nucleic acid-binding protein